MKEQQKAVCPHCMERVVPEATTVDDAWHWGCASPDDRNWWLSINTTKCPSCGGCGSQDDFEDVQPSCKR